ncbi:hypothetical protein ACQ5SK_43475 [Bradyrhizobium japonicum]
MQLDSSSIWDTNGRFTSVNGIVQPTLTVPAGEIQRWRFVHAGIHDTINIQLVRATPVGTTNLIATSALSGNRQQQKADLLAACNASPGTLIPQFEIASDGRPGPNRAPCTPRKSAACSNRTTCSPAIAATSSSYSPRTVTIAC